MKITKQYMLETIAQIDNNMSKILKKLETKEKEIIELQEEALEWEAKEKARTLVLLEDECVE